MDNLGNERKEPTLGGPEKPPAEDKAEIAAPQAAPRAEPAPAKPRAPGEPAHVKPGQYDIRSKPHRSKQNNRNITLAAAAALLAIGTLAGISNLRAKPEAQTVKATPAKQPVAQVDCSKAFEAMHRGAWVSIASVTVGGCEVQFEALAKQVRTDYSIKGGALLLKDSTHSLVGMSIERGETQLFPSRHAVVPAVIATNGGKVVATLRFGNPQEVDVAFKLLSDAIASASARCTKC
jgi:hypothetical protein